MQFDAIGKNVHQTQADTTAAVQAAMDHITADAKQRDALLATQRKEDRAAIESAIESNADAQTKQFASQLAKVQTENAAQLKASQDQQAQNTKDFGARIDQNAKAIVALQTESAKRIDSLEKHLDQYVSGIQDDLQSVRKEIEGILWFHWPVSSKSTTDHEKAQNVPTTFPAR